MIDTYSDAWRWECLARTVCRMPNKDSRKAFLRRWEKRHGSESAIKLKKLVREQWAILQQKEKTNVKT